jgi:hypothetical protein
MAAVWRPTTSLWDLVVKGDDYRRQIGSLGEKSEDFDAFGVSGP